MHCTLKGKARLPGLDQREKSLDAIPAHPGMCPPCVESAGLKGPSAGRCLSKLEEPSRGFGFIAKHNEGVAPSCGGPVSAKGAQGGGEISWRDLICVLSLSLILICEDLGPFLRD